MHHRLSPFIYRDQGSFDLTVNRYYSPVYGRFTSPDPYRASGGPANPQSWNRYTYVQGDPVNRLDPTGLYCENPDFHVAQLGDGCAGGGGGGGGGYIFWPEAIYDSEGTRIGWGFTPSPLPPGGGGVNWGGGGTAAPVPCPPVPSATPPGVSIDSNMKTAETLRSAIRMDGRGAGGLVTIMMSFYAIVKNHGPMDYKQLRGEHEEFGNFNYGVVGSALGLDEELLLRAAGRAQVEAGTSRPGWGRPANRFFFGGVAPFGDDPNDQAAIKRGIQYFNAKKAGCI